MAAKIQAGGVFGNLERTYSDIRNPEKMSEYHLSSDVLVEHIKNEAFLGAQTLVSFYKEHLAGRFQELATFSSVLTAAHQKYSDQTEAQRKTDAAVAEKDQCLKNYWALMDSFQKARAIGAQLLDVEQFLAPSSKNNPASSTRADWEGIVEAAKDFRSLAEGVDQRCGQKAKSIEPEKTEFFEVGKKALQGFEERHGPATLEFLKLFVDCTRVPREEAVNPAEEKANAEALLRQREILCGNIFSQAQVLYEQESSRISKVESVLANFREVAIVFNTQLKKSQVDIKDTNSLKQRITLYRNLTEYLTVEVCKIGVFAAQLKLIGRFLTSTQPLENVGTRFIAQAQFTEYLLVKKDKEFIAQQHGQQVFQWARRAESSYCAAMKELEGSESAPTLLNHVLDRFLSYRDNNWAPLSLLTTGAAFFGRVVSGAIPVLAASTKAPAVYKKEFWDREEAVIAVPAAVADPVAAPQTEHEFSSPPDAIAIGVAAFKL